MIIHFYSCLDGDNVINKTLGVPKSFEIRFKADVDIVNPEIIMQVTATDDFSGYNYCYIPELKRFYFIRTSEFMNNKVRRMRCECDYLETYKHDIIASQSSYSRKLGAGSYGEVQLDLTGREVVTTYTSNVALEPFVNSILTVLGGS